MHKPESAQQNETQKIIWDFKIQTNCVTPARRVLINNKKIICHLVDQAVPGDYCAKMK